MKKSHIFCQVKVANHLKKKKSTSLVSGLLYAKKKKTWMCIQKKCHGGIINASHHLFTSQWIRLILRNGLKYGKWLWWPLQRWQCVGWVVLASRSSLLYLCMSHFPPVEDESQPSSEVTADGSHWLILRGWGSHRGFQEMDEGKHPNYSLMTYIYALSKTTCRSCDL